MLADIMSLMGSNSVCAGKAAAGERGRGNSLAELGITEEEFEEYAQRKPRRDKDGDNPETETLAMGMDVDLSQAPKQAAKLRTGAAQTVK